jgi:toxoflavin synthase
MSDDYEKIADDYDQTFIWMNYRIYIEEHSVVKQLGQIEGKTFLDLACGTGHYSRVLKRRGAKRVVGTDISAEMVRVANEYEQREPMGNTYFVSDAADVKLEETFDRSMAVYLLHYAPTFEHLTKMCQSAARQLVPGGQFLTYQMNPEIERSPGY